MTEHGIHSPVYPLHFANFYERKASTYGFRYYRKSPRKKTVIPSTIPSLKIKTFKNKGYLLAGFHDLNIRKRCVQELKQFLSDYQNIDKEISNIKNLNSHQKKLFIIMATYAQQFGLHLIYNILSHLKVVGKQDFRYMNIINQYLDRNQL
jgi:hypothetical protein